MNSFGHTSTKIISCYIFWLIFVSKKLLSKNISVNILCLGLLFCWLLNHVSHEIFLIIVTILPPISKDWSTYGETMKVVTMLVYYYTKKLMLVYLYHYKLNKIIMTIHQIYENLQKSPKSDKHMLTKWYFSMT